MGRKILDFIGQYIIALISVIISGVLFWKFSPNTSVSITTFMWFVIPLGLCVVVAIPQLIKYWTLEDKNVIFPRLRTIVDDVLVFDESNLFSTQCVVTLFYMDEEIERTIGVGFVETVKSDNHYLQIRLLELKEEYDEKFLKKNKRHILIKPNCPYDLIRNNVEQKQFIGGNNE